MRAGSRSQGDGRIMSNEFVSEAKEHLANITDDLLALEQGVAEGFRYRLDRLCRSMHSVKGGAGFFGYSTIAELGHAMESLLDHLKQQPQPPTPSVIDVLLSGVDYLSVLVDDIDHSNEADIAPILTRLRALLPAGKDAVDQHDISTGGGPNAELAEQLRQSPARQQCPPSKRLYLLQLELHSLYRHCRLSPQSLIHLLTQNGELLEARLEVKPTDLVEGLPRGALWYFALYATALQKDTLGQLIGLPVESIEQLQDTSTNSGSPQMPASPSVSTSTLPPVLAPSALLPASSASAAPLPTSSAPSAPMPMSSASPSVVGAMVPPTTAAAGGPTLAESARKIGEPPSVVPPIAVPSPKPDEASRKDDKARTVRISVDLLDRLMTAAGELVLVRNQSLLAIDQSDITIRRIMQRLNSVTSEIQEAVMRTRMQPISNLFGKFPRLVRDLSRQLGKQIEFITEGNEVELDKTILEMLSDPLTHMVRNACDHGIESPEERRCLGKSATGRIHLGARHEGSQITITISDDGRGIDPNKVRRKALQNGLRTEAELAHMSDKEVFQLILLPGFSTVEQVTEISGRGVGMDVVRTNIDQLGGSMQIDSILGRGSTFHLRLPLTVAIIPCLIVVCQGERYAIPQKDLEELVCVYPQQRQSKLEYAYDQEVYRLRDRLLPLVRLSEVLARRRPFTANTRAEIVRKYQQAGDSESMLNIAVVKAGSNRFGLIVDRILTTEEIVVKPMHSTLKPLRCYSGATIMGDGRVALILDIEGIARHAAVSLESTWVAVDRSKSVAATRDDDQDRQTVLLFRYGPQEQFAMALPMIRRIEALPASRIERVGPKEFVTIDGVSTWILRLNQFLTVSECEPRDHYFLLLPRNVRRPVGILMSALLDTATLCTELSTEGIVEEGVIGTAIVAGKLTLFLDIFRLMDRIDPAQLAERKRRLELNAQAGKRRILLVDDTQFFRQLVRGYLEAEGYEVETAIHGAQALDLLQERGPFDMIVSDIEMPVMNGWDFAQTVRQRGDTRGIPMLALSTLSSETDKEKAIRCGFDAYEVKVDRESFLNSVAQLLRQPRATAMGMLGDATAGAGRKGGSDYGCDTIRPS